MTDKDIKVRYPNEISILFDLTRINKPKIYNKCEIIDRSIFTK